MALYYGITIPAKLCYEGIAYYKYGKKDVKLLLDLLNISEEMRDKKKLYEDENCIRFLWKREFGDKKKLSDILWKESRIELITLNIEKEEFPSLPIFIGITKELPERQMLHLNEISNVITEKDKNKVKIPLQKLGLDQFPISLTLGNPSVEDFPEEINPPSDYSDYSKNKL